MISLNQNAVMRISNHSNQAIHVLWKGMKNQNHYHTSIEKNMSICISEIPSSIEILGSNNKYETFYPDQQTSHPHVIYKERSPHIIKQSRTITNFPKKREPRLDSPDKPNDNSDLFL